MKDIILIISLMSLLVPGGLYAQRGMQWRGSGGWGPGSQYNRVFDVNSVSTVHGEVVGIEHFTPMKGMYAGIHLRLKTESETIPIHLGPVWFVENQDMKIEVNDHIQVVGSRVLFDGKPAIIGSEITKNNETFHLRDKNGFPLWSGWKRR